MTHKLDEMLEHAGVKGMKWGVRKRDKAPKKTITVQTTRTTEHTPDKFKGVARSLVGTPLALPVGLALSARNISRRSKMKKHIARGLNSRPTDFKRRDLKDATSIALEFRNIKIVSSDGKSVKMAAKLDELLLHAGVKGMKWGVRKRDVKSSGPKNAPKIIASLKEKAASSKRERSWSKIDTNGLSNQELNKIAQRVQLENDFKRVSKQKKVGTKQDQKDYLKRDKMSDQELMDRVTRLRAKSNMTRTAKEATKSQTDFAKSVVSTVAPVVVTYAMTGSVSKTDMARAVFRAKDAFANKQPDSLGKAAAGIVGRAVKDERNKRNNNSSNNN